ncbi:solute carrier family 22 member 5-like isoform X2 [Anarrhichthys ocellatus]|uniref:solute carrier family 22 member 5-like isoform X2 n=1 Tax=Anarrhichthys ocellatus TaxID=433405 RepID=UPI0012EDCA04|nr:solute carrier family 22 member 5-like isoform X2 [Anarrhichthys ocellatus]
MKDYDDSVAFLGQWGRFQQVVFFLLSASILPNGYGAFSVVFLADTPSHHCLVPHVNLTQDWLNAIIPIEGFIPGRDVNITDLEQEGCVDGWSYSRDIYQSTIVSEFDLVCRDQWKQPFTSTIYFLGVLVGSFFSGQLSDRFGRKPVFFATMAVQTIFTFVQIFSPSWMVFVILYFMNGLGQISNYVSAFVLGNEILTGHVRVLFSSLGVCLGYAIGYMMLPLFAYFLRDWKSLLLAISLPGLLYIPLWWFIPESPRWLLSQGRVEEAETTLRKAAKMNKVKAPSVIFEDYSVHADATKTQPKEQHNVFSLLRTKNIRNLTVILCLVWFTLSTGYYGLSLNTSQLHANPYISCFLSAAVEVPAYTSSWLALRYVPRRQSVFCIFLIGGVSLYFLQLVPKSLSELSVALEMLGKFVITIGTSLIYAYTAELYPTPLRNTATGTCSAVAKVGSSIAPFLLQLISVQNTQMKSCRFTRKSSVQTAVGAPAATKFQPSTCSQSSSRWRRALLPATAASPNPARSRASPCCSTGPPGSQQDPSPTAGTAGGKGVTREPEPGLSGADCVYFKYLPYIVMGTLAVVSAFATLLLPESFGRPLPQTIQQMHKRESIKCPFITRRKHSKPPMLSKIN